MIKLQFTAWIKLESRMWYEFWIGLTDSKEEGVYEWRSGRPLSPELGRHWKAGEPNNYRGNEYCVQMYGLEMNDKDCSNYMNFVCERRNVTAGEEYKERVCHV